MTGVPFGNRLVSPPPEISVTVPCVGTPWIDSFQPSSFASASMAGSSSGMFVNVPSVAIPVDWLL